MNMIVRPATSADVPALAASWKDTYQDFLEAGRWLSAPCNDQLALKQQGATRLTVFCNGVWTRCTIVPSQGDAAAKDLGDGS